MKICIIVAIDANNGIGKDNNLLCRLQDDMKFFVEVTTGHPVVMGRKTYESIPKKFRPLADRKNIILSRTVDSYNDGSIVVKSLDDAIDVAADAGVLFIAGGSEIYKQALDAGIVDEMYVTEIDREFEADSFFPKIGDDWEEISRRHHDIDKKHRYAFDFVKYIKCGK